MRDMKKITCPTCRETNFYLLVNIYTELFYGHNKFRLVWKWIKDLILKPKIIKEYRIFIHEKMGEKHEQKRFK